MEFIPTESITGTVGDWLGLDQETNILNDMGLMLVIGVAMVMVLVLIVAVSFIAQKYSFAWYRRYRKFK